MVRRPPVDHRGHPLRVREHALEPERVHVQSAPGRAVGGGDRRLHHQTASSRRSGTDLTAAVRSPGRLYYRLPARPLSQALAPGLQFRCKENRRGRRLRHVARCPAIALFLGAAEGPRPAVGRAVAVDPAHADRDATGAQPVLLAGRPRGESAPLHRPARHPARERRHLRTEGKRRTSCDRLLSNQIHRPPHLQGQRSRWRLPGDPLPDPLGRRPEVRGGRHGAQESRGQRGVQPARLPARALGGAQSRRGE